MAATRHEYCITGDGTYCSIAGLQQNAMTFTVGHTGTNEDHEISSIKVKASIWESLPANDVKELFVAIKAVDGANKPTGVDLSTGYVSEEDVEAWGATPAWRTISMSAYTLLASTQYALVFRSPDTTGAINWRFDSTGEYTAGDRVQSTDGGSSWSIDSNSSCMFEIWGEAAGVDVTVYPATFALALTQHAPTISFDCIITPSTFELALTLPAPTVVFDVTVTPVTLELAATLETPTVEIAVVITPDAFELVVDLPPPSVLFPLQTILPDTFELALQQETPLVVFPAQTMLPDTQELALTLHAPTIVTAVNVTVYPDTFELALTQPAPSLSFGSTVIPATFELALTLHAPDVPTGIIIYPDTFELALALQTPIIWSDITFIPATFELAAALHTPAISAAWVDIPPFMEKDLIDPYSGGAWLWLVEIAVPGQVTQRIARNTEDVPYGGDDFARANLQIGEQIFSGDGSIPRVTLRVFQDANRVMEEIINETEGALGAQIKLIRVNEKFLNTPVAALEANYDNLASESDTEWVTFTLGVPNPLTQRYPLDIYSSSTCPLATPTLFKGPRCQYAGADGTCTGTYEDCYVKGNAHHWGAELGLDPNVVRV